MFASPRYKYPISEHTATWAKMVFAFNNCDASAMNTVTPPKKPNITIDFCKPIVPPPNERTGVTSLMLCLI